MKNVDYSTSVETRVLNEANYIVSKNSTIRQCAKMFGISKSEVYLDVTKRLKALDSDLASDVRKVLDKNKAERSFRGGLATRLKYLKMK